MKILQQISLIKNSGSGPSWVRKRNHRVREGMIRREPIVNRRRVGWSAGARLPISYRRRKSLRSALARSFSIRQPSPDVGLGQTQKQTKKVTNICWKICWLVGPNARNFRMHMCNSPNMVRPICINSATEWLPSRANSCSCDAIRATASGWLRRTPRASRRCANEPTFHNSIVRLFIYLINSLIIQ